MTHQGDTVKSATIRELKHDTTRVLAMVASGETVEVQRRGRPVAVLSPVRRPKRAKRPDYAARLREIYGRTELGTTGTDLVAEARGET